MPGTPRKEGPPASRLRNRRFSEDDLTTGVKKESDKGPKPKTPRRSKKKATLSEEQLKSQQVLTAFMDLGLESSKGSEKNKDTCISHAKTTLVSSNSANRGLVEQNVPAVLSPQSLNSSNNTKALLYHVSADGATRTTINNSGYQPIANLNATQSVIKGDTPQITMDQRELNLLSHGGATVNAFAISTAETLNAATSTEIATLVQGAQVGEDSMKFTFNPSMAGIGVLDGRLFSSQPAGPSVSSGTAISTSEVYRMLGEVNKSLREIKKDMSEMKTAKQHTENTIDSMQFEIDRLNEETQIQSAVHKKDQDKINLLSGSMIKLEQQVQQMQEKLLDVEKRSMRSNLVISGIPEEEDENCKEKCDTFIHDSLKLRGENIQIKRAHRLGVKQEGYTRQMVMKLTNPGQKGPIFQNTSNLKGSNKYVNDQLPQELDERKRRMRQIVAANKKLPPGLKQVMQIEKGVLYIGEKNKGQRKYVPPITTPKIEQLLKLSDEELVGLEEMEIYKSTLRTEQDSTFQMYGAVVSSKAEIRKLYLHLKIKHLDATHVSLVYRLAGVDKAEDEGFCDDGEAGLGRKLLKQLVEEDRKQIACFAVRYYGGKNVGKKRFQIPSELMSQVIKEFGVGIVPISKLKLNQSKIDSPATTVKQRSFQTVRGRRRKTSNLGASPLFTQPKAQSNMRKKHGSEPQRSSIQQKRSDSVASRNQITDYLKRIEQQTSDEEISYPTSCPTSATSNDDNTEEEDFLSVEEDRRPLEDWSNTVEGGWTTDSQEESGSQVSTEVEVSK